MAARKLGFATTVTAVLVALATVGSALAVTAGATAGSGSAVGREAPVTPAAGALAVALSPSPASIDNGQSVNLTASASGGTPPYTSYTWYEGTFQNCSGDPQVATTTVDKYTVSGLTTDHYVCVRVTDNATPTPNNATSPSDFIVVNSALVVGTVGPAAALAPTGAIDSGQSVVLTAGAVNGTPPLKYQWYSGPTPSSCTQNQVSGATLATLTVKPTVSTSYCYVVADSSVGYPVQSGQSAGATVTVDAALAPAAPSPAGLYGDSGQSFTLRANPAGGTGTYTYQWYAGTSATCSSDLTTLGTAKAQLVTPAATTYYCYALSDTSYNPPVTSSPTTVVTVNATLVAGGITPAAPAIDAGTAESVTLTASPSGGALNTSQGYSYQWRSGTYSSCTSDPSVGSGGRHATFTAAPTTSTFYCYAVADANGTVAYSSTVLLSVNPALSGGSPSPASLQIDAGQSAVVTAGPTGGTPPYAYQWFVGTSCTGGSLIAGATGPTLTVTAGGSYVYRVTDSSIGALAIGQRSECSVASASVVVNSDPVPTAPKAAPAALDLGQSVTLTGSVVTGTGTPVITYQWRSGASKNCSQDANVAGATSSSYTTFPLSSAFYCYAVTDGSVNPPTELSSTVFVTVNGVPVAGAVTPNGVAFVDLGTNETVTLVAHPSGGTGTYSYQWYSGPFASCSSDGTMVGTNSPTYTTPVHLTSSTDYCYAVTDAAGKTGSTATGFLVTVEPALVAGKPTAAVTSADVGQTVTVTANATGGTSPYTYQWFSAGNASCGGLSLIAGATSSPATIAPYTPGTAYFCYRVTDASNGTPVQQSAYTTSAVPVTIYATLVAGTVACYDNTAKAACATAVPSGDSVTLTAQPSNGNTAAYVYQWYSGTSSVCSSDLELTGATGATYTTTASSSPGAYYCYVVTDGPHGESATSPTLYLDPPAGGSSTGSLLAAVALRGD